MLNQKQNLKTNLMIRQQLIIESPKAAKLHSAQFIIIRRKTGSKYCKIDKLVIVGLFAKHLLRMDG